MIAPTPDSNYEDAYIELEKDRESSSAKSQVLENIKGIAGKRMGLPESEEDTKKYEATIFAAEAYGDCPFAIEKFDTFEEANTWMVQEINKRTRLIERFENILEKDEIGLTKTIETKLVEIGRENLLPIDSENYYPNLSKGIAAPQLKGLFIAAQPGQYGKGSRVTIGVDNGHHYIPKHFYQSRSHDHAILFALYAALIQEQ